MCSVGDDFSEDSENSKFMQEKQQYNLQKTRCNKCRKQFPCVVLRGKDVYCKDCFLSGTLHKFKALLGKHRFIRPQDRVLIWHKPGHPSTALLHFLKTGVELSTPKKLRFEPVFVFLEDLWTAAIEERECVLKNIQNEVTNCKFPIYFVSFAQYIINSYKIDDLVKTDFQGVQIDDSHSTAIENVVHNLTFSDREQFLQILKHRLLRDIAKHLHCSCIFIPDISADVASNLLTNISLGRGGQVSFDTGVCDMRDPDIKIIKPLRIFEMKELAFYNVFNRLEPVNLLGLQQEWNDGVQSLMKKFVNDLQVNYPATITTVINTGDKLIIGESDNEIRTCSLCKAPKDPHRNTLNSAKATAFSHWLSTREAINGHVEEEGGFVDDFKEESLSDFCFSCKKIAPYVLVNE